MPSTRRQKVKSRRSRELDILSDIENMDVLIGNSDANSIERELRNVYDGSVETGRDHESNERNTQGSSSQANEFRNIQDVHVDNENKNRDNIETLSNELNDRISREISQGDCQKTGNFARLCRSKNKEKPAKRIGLLNEDNYTSEDDGSSDEYSEFCQIIQINKILPYENDQFGVQMKVNGNQQNLIIHRITSHHNAIQQRKSLCTMNIKISTKTKANSQETLVHKKYKNEH